MAPHTPRHKQNSEEYALMQLLRKTQSQFTRLDQQQIFSDKFLILKFLFNELEQFYSSSSSNSEKLFFRVQVRVRQNNRVFSSSSSQPCLVRKNWRGGGELINCY